MKEYYFHDGSTQHGPFTFEELKQQNIKPDTSVWHTNISDWKKASQFDELREIFQKTPTPPPISKSINKTKSRSNLLYYLIGIVIIAFIAYQLYTNNQRRDQEIVNSQIYNTKNNIRKLVTVGNSAYQINALGGISGLSITITNTTDYLLDKVLVSVRYIKANGEDWKKETLDFTLVPPRTQMTLRAPDSDRGTSIDYKIVSISSSALGL
jgi:hypothetical protein